MFRSLILATTVSVLLVIGGSANAGLIFSDNWNDQTVLGPSFAAPGVDWHVDSGAVAADTMPGFCGEYPGTLMLDSAQFSQVSVNFGATAPGTPVEARFKLHQSNGAGGASYTFNFGFKNTASGQVYEEYATLNPGYFGTSGFNKWINYGGGTYGLWAGAAGYSLTNSWNYMKMSFDPASGVQVWQAVTGAENLSYDDPSLQYTMVADWINYWPVSSVNQFYINNGNAVVSWKVEDFELSGTPVPEPSSILALAVGVVGMIGSVRRKH